MICIGLLDKIVIVEVCPHLPLTGLSRQRGPRRIGTVPYLKTPDRKEEILAAPVGVTGGKALDDTLQRTTVCLA